MKKLLLLVLLPIGLWGQTTIFNISGGGSAPSGWSHINTNSTEPIDKTSYWLVETNPKDTIYSAVYNLSAYTSAIFYIDVATFGTGGNNSARIEVSFDGGATYTQSTTTGTPTSSTYITNQNFTLSSVTSQIKLRITNNGSTGRGVRLQNIKLEASGTSCTPPGNPTGSISQTNNCGSVDLSYTGTPTNTYWQTSATGTSLTNPVSSAYNATSAGTYYARAYDGTSCWSTGTVSTSVSSIVNNTSISAHPSNRIITVGQNTSFSVTATNSPSYQWQVNTGSGFISISNGGVYSNATTSTLNITAATIGMSGYTYRCVVTSASPCTNIVNSNSATLTVNLPVWEDFETGTKASYTSGSVTCTAGSWTMNDALLGTLANDRKNGGQSVRVQNSGIISMNFNKTNGLDSLIIFHAIYGSDGSSTWRLEASDDNGSSWTAYVSSAITTSSTTLTRQMFSVKIGGNVRFRIVKLTGGANRINFDDITVSNFVCSVNSLGTSSSGTLSKKCTESGWSYYGDGTNDYFAINKNGNTFTETVTVTVSSAAVDSSKSSNGGNQEHASYLMKRYWNVDCGGCAPTINGGVSIRFFYDPADSTAAHNAMRAGFLALKATNVNTLADTTTSMQWVKNNTGTPYAPSMFTGNRMTVAHIKLNPIYGSLNGVRYVQFDTIKSFSGGGGGFGFGPSSGGGIGLPVTWAGLDASLQVDYTELVWHTASEQNTSHFEVEASYDGKVFNTISENIPAAGNSASLLSYSFIDRNLAPIKYYRLRQVDMESSFEYSKIIVAKRTQEASQAFEVIAYPLNNTESKQYQLLLKNTSADVSSIQVLDYTGKPVYTENTTSHSEILDLSHLTPGIYMLQVWNGGERKVVRIAL